MSGLHHLRIPAIAIVLIAVSGILHAVQTGAWSAGKRQALAAGLLQQLPLSIGDWRGQELDIDADEFLGAEASGMISRSYTRSDRQSVSIMLLCGPAGPIAVHPPTVCFTGAGYQQLSAQRRVAVLGRDGAAIGTFWVADFEKTVDGAPLRIRTYWGWNADDGWKAPEYPRITFAGKDVLHKLYVTQVLNPNHSEELCETFLTELVPALEFVQQSDAT